MDNLKGFMKIVKVPETLHMTSKSGNENGMSLKAMKKELEDKMNEKAKVYGFIGMEVYDLSKENKIEIRLPKEATIEEKFMIMGVAMMYDYKYYHFGY